jgi:hypothetical protein
VYACVLALVVAGALIATVQARPGSEERAQRAAERQARAAERRENRQARGPRQTGEKATHKVRIKRGPGGERPNVIVSSTCTMITWTWRKFPNMPGNTIREKVSVAHYTPVFQTHTFDGEGNTQETPVRLPPSRRNRLDTKAHWNTNGLRGHFDIPSKKGCPPAPEFKIEKRQQIAGGGEAFTTAPLKGLVGQTVNYQITIQNTGNVPLVLSNFIDEHCDSSTISGGQGETPLPPGPMPSLGGKTTYTCTHVLTSLNAYQNDGAITATPPPGEGSPITHTSNIVVVNGVAPTPGFSIEKLQMIEGAGGSFTTSPLHGEVGQTVDYRIVVKNTGNTSLTFSSFTDEHCDSGSIEGGPTGALLPSESATYTCKHALTSADQTAGSYSNSASDTATPPGEAPITHTSNTVVVSLTTLAPAFTIEKLQKIEGSTGSFTTAPLSGEVGQTVDHEIVVKDTGNTALTFSNFTDEHCDGGTIAGGPSGPLAPTESATYTCKHVLTSADQTAGSYSNSASDTATPPGGSATTHTSNTVVVTIGAPPPPQPAIYVGYGDGAANNHGGANGFPSPWNGSSGVTFVGCGFGGSDTCPKSNGVDVYDAGAIRIDAPSGGSTLSVTGAKLVIGPCTYEPWPSLNVALAPGHTLILTQTGKHQCTTGSSEQDNFDTSESFLKSPQYAQFQKTGKCTSDGFVPAVTLTINGHTVTLSDSTRVLNTGGADPDICTKTTEWQNWVALSLPAGQSFARVAQAPACRARRGARHHRRSRCTVSTHVHASAYVHASATVLVKVL